MFGNPHEGDKVLPTLDKWGKIHADTYRALNKAAHQPHAGDLDRLISDSRSLVKKIEEKLP